MRGSIYFDFLLRLLRLLRPAVFLGGLPVEFLRAFLVDSRGAVPYSLN